MMFHNSLKTFVFCMGCVVSLHGANAKPFIVNPMNDVDAKTMNDNLIMGKARTDKPVVSTSNDSSTLDMPDDLSAPTLKPQATQKNTQKQVPNLPKDEYGYDDEVVLNWVMRHDTETKAQKSKNKKDAYKTSFYTPEKKEEKKEDTTAKNTQNQDVNQSKLDGFSAKCLVNKTHTIRGVKASKMIEVTCKNDDGIYFEMGIELIPDNDNYALLGKAKYLIDEAGNYYVLDSDKSMVRNIDGSDSNIASTVNIRTLEKFNATVQKEMAKGMSESAKSYMEDDKAYRRNSQTTITANGTVVTSGSAEKPDLATNVVYGLVQGVLGVWDKTSDAITSNLPFLYELADGSLLNVFAVKASNQTKALQQSNNNQITTNKGLMK